MIQVVARPNPFNHELVRFEEPAGMCVAELVVRAMDVAQQPVRLAACACVTVNERRVDKASWLDVVPDDNSTLVINALPGDDFGSLFVTIAAFALAAWIPPLGGLTIGGLSVGQFAVRVGITLVGAMISQAIAPGPRQTLTNQAEPDAPASYSITGVRNEAKPYGTIPMIYGRLVNYHPPLVAIPYTDANNAYGDQFLHMVFGWMGESSISDIKLGDTAYSLLRNLTLETRQGTQSDSGITLYPSQVREQSLNVQLKYANGFTFRNTEPDTDEVVVEVLFPGGMGRLTDRNEKLGIVVRFQVLYFGTGFSGYLAAPIQAHNQFSVYIEGGGIFSVQGYSKAAVRRSVRFTVPRGEYSVGVARITVDDQSDTSGDHQSTTFEDSILVSIRSIRYQAPFTQGGLSLIAVRAQANDQLNGVIDNLNCTVQRLLPIWNGSSWSSPQATRNPAWAFCDVLRGYGNSRPLADSDDRINLSEILTWAQACDNQGLYFDSVLDARRSVWEVLQEIASAGFASPTVRDGQFSIVHDTTRNTPVQHFSGRNSWNFSVSRTFGDIPHALTIRFPNELTLRQTDEIIVYDDGYTAANATRFEAMDLPYVSSATAAWKIGRRYLATARLRPRIISLDTDIEFLICERGDLVRIARDTMLVGIDQARVKSLTLDGSNNLTHVTLDTVMEMEADVSYCLRFRKATGATVYNLVVTAAGSTQTLELNPMIGVGNPMPEVGDLVFFGTAGSESIECLVRSIVPRSDLSATMTFVDYSPAIFTAHLGPIPDFNPRISLRPRVQRRSPAPPVILSVDSDERALSRLPNGTVVPGVLIAYEVRPDEDDLPAVSVQVRWRISIEAGDPQHLILPVQTGIIKLQPVDEGDIVIAELRTIADAGATSEWVSVTHTVIGRIAPPPNVDQLYRAGNSLIWPYDNAPIDLAGFLLRAHYGTNSSWTTARPLHLGVITSNTFDISNLSGPHTILVKAVDTTGNESAEPAVIYLNLGDVIVSNVVVTQAEGPGFTGELEGGTDTGTELETDLLSSQPAYPDLNAGAFDPPGDPAYPGTVYSEMTYVARYTPDVDHLYDGLLKLVLDVDGPYSVDFRISVSTPAFDPGGDPAFDPPTDPAYGEVVLTDWTAWPGVLGPFDSVDEIYDIRITCRGGVSQGVISQFDLVTDLPDVIEHFEDVVITGGLLTVAPTKTFRELLNVQVTLQDDGGTARLVRVLSKDATLGAEIETRNISNVLTQGTVDLTFQGY